MNPENPEAENDMVEKAKQLLLLTDLVDRYPQAVARRVAGLIYLIIAGGISFATLILMTLQDIFGTGNALLVNIAFVFISLFFSWVVAFRLVAPLTQSYPKDPRPDESGRGVILLWGILAIAIVVIAFVSFQSDLEYLFAPALQMIMGFGFSANYVLGRRGEEVEFYSREHAFFAIAVFLSVIPMLMFLQYSYVFIIIVDMGGIYIIGIYMLATAERILLESKGQG